MRGCPSVTPTLQTVRPGLITVATAVWMPGVGAAFSSVGFGAILAFGSLLFVERGWKPIWLAFTAYAVSLVITRVFIGHLPDRIGGAKVALVSILVEAGGLLLIALAPNPSVAAVGAGLT